MDIGDVQNDIGDIHNVLQGETNWFVCRRWCRYSFCYDGRILPS